MSLGLGYNASDVIASIRAVNNAYNALMVALVNTTQSQFVNQMQDNWASEDAYQFFNLSFKPAIDEITSNATKVFQSVVDSMNSAGRAWAEFQKVLGAILLLNHLQLN